VLILVWDYFSDLRFCCSNDGKNEQNSDSDGAAIVVRELRRRFGRQQVLDGVKPGLPARADHDNRGTER